MSDPLRMWTLYENPYDYPRLFVARLWLVEKTAVSTPEIIIGNTQEDVERQLPQGLYFIPRAEGDDPNIIGTYV